MRFVAHRNVTLATAIALAAAPALAASSSVAIEHLRFEAIDLDPNDGITAAATPQPWNIVLAIGKSVTGHHGSFNDMAFEMRFAPEVTDPIGPVGYADGDISGTTQSFGGNLLSASGWAAHASAQTLNSTVGVAVYAGIFANIPFTLTAKTQLRITAAVPTLTYDETGNGLSYARTVIQVSGDSIPWQSTMVFSGHCVANDICPVDGFPPPADPFDNRGPLEFTLTNNTDQFQSGYMYLQVQAFAESLAAPAPEPSGAALLLGGLATLGAWARRRKPLTAG